MAKELNFAEMAELILEKGLPIGYFELEKKKGYRNLMGSFREVYGRGTPSYSSSHLARELGISKSSVGGQFERYDAVYLAFLIYLLSRVEERHFLDYYPFFKAYLIKIQLTIPCNRKIVAEIQDMHGIDLPTSKKQVNDWLVSIKEHLLKISVASWSNTGRATWEEMSRRDWSETIKVLKQRIAKLEKEEEGKKKK